MSSLHACEASGTVVQDISHPPDVYKRQIWMCCEAGRARVSSASQKLLHNADGSSSCGEVNNAVNVTQVALEPVGTLHGADRCKLHQELFESKRTVSRQQATEGGGSRANNNKTKFEPG